MQNLDFSLCVMGHMVCVYLKNRHREDSHISFKWSPSSRRWKSKASGLEFPDDSNMKIQILATNITLKYHLIAPHPNKNHDFKKCYYSRDMFTSKINILSGGKNIFCLAYQLRQPKRMPKKAGQPLQTRYILLGCPWYGT